MSIQCPTCAYTINVKNPKPGRYAPKCPKCGNAFSLTIPADPDAPWQAAALLSEKTKVDSEPPAPPKPAPKPSVKLTPKPPSPDVTQATGAFDSIDPPSAKPAPKKPAPSFESTEATGGFDHDEAPPPPPKKKPAPKPAPKDVDATEVTGGFDAPEPSEKEDVDQTAIGGVTRGAGGNDATWAGDAPEDDVEESKAAPSRSSDEQEMPDRLGGYELGKRLGQGGMGSVYLARQISLDRSVALKVMNARWAQDPIFLARFTREAYAAAQLVHHNVVQIYDIGEDHGINFFSMEFVEGKSLGDVVKKQGKMEPEAAAGYVLQAARGLRYAHERGMIHRDIKPDNLMLNTFGVVKVADLGLVKTPAMSAAEDALPDAVDDEDHSSSRIGKSQAGRTGLSSLPTDMTNAMTAMGSPAYMSPEQCRNAAGVDHRADIYSLGCTLYALLTGHPPFGGTTAFEVMTKHATEEPTPVQEVEKKVPKKLAAVCMKMLVKEADQRYQTMDEVIADLEKCLGTAGGKFNPTEEHLTKLEECVEKFNNSSAAKLRRKVIPLFSLAAIAGAIAFLFINATIAGGLLGMFVCAAITYFIANGVGSKTHLFAKTREAVLGARLTDWITWIFGIIILHGVLFLIGVLWMWLAFGAGGVVLALLFHFLIDGKVTSQRRPALDEAQHLFKRLRLMGMEEDALRLFVAKYSGKNWEEFYEALFGFDAKIAMRPNVEQAEGAEKPNRFGTWREPLLNRIERVQAARRAAKERKHLKAVEAKKLEAEGVDRKEAEEQAEAAAAQMVEQAAEIKAAEAAGGLVWDDDEEGAPPRKKVNLREMVRNVEKAPKKLPKQPARPFKAIFNFVFSWKPRFILAAILITGSLLWVKQNLARISKDLQTIQSIGEVGSSGSAKEGAQKAIGIWQAIVDIKEPWHPLELSFLPYSVTKFFSSANGLAAGGILLLSLFFRGFLVQVCFLVATAVAFIAHHLPVPIPEVGPLRPPHLAMIAGTVIAVVGIFLFRRKGSDD